jgi:hypothetical protein
LGATVLWLSGFSGSPLTQTISCRALPRRVIIRREFIDSEFRFCRHLGYDESEGVWRDHAQGQPRPTLTFGSP